MYKIKGRILAMLMVLVLCIGQFNVVIARDNGGQIQGTVTVAIEKFTLGEGYYIEPINVPFYENDKVGNVVARIIGSGKYNNGTDSENIGYLVNVYDEHLDMLNIPTYITNQLDQEGGILPQTDEWLGESDYTATSGWMYVVNNASANVGMGDYICADGDVIRLQFSLYGWGADIGMDNSAWGYPALIVSANKDALTKLIATINDRADKQTLLEKEVPDEGVTVETYYNAAMQELTNIEAEQEAIDEVYEKLQSVVAVLDEQDQQVAKPDEKDQSTHEKTKNERIEDILSAVSEEYKNYSYEWSIMDMAAYGLKDSLRQEDIDAYVKDAKELIQTSSKGTDFDKTAIIFTSLGIDPRTVTMEDGSSFDIIDYIATSERMDLINGAAFALLAYDSNNYPVVDKKWTREAVIQYIKDAQRPDGGWALMPFLGTDIDITAMVLSSLALYYNAEEDTYQVKECVEKAINCLSNVQKEDGLYAYGTAKNSNTVAMVIIALSALGIDADKDPRFIKNGVSTLDALLFFETPDHKIGYTNGQSENAMATEQGFRALVNYKAFKESGEPAYVYQFIPKSGVTPEPTVTPAPTASPNPTESPVPTSKPSDNDQPATITVSFKLIGDSHHEEPSKHKESETWIPATNYTVPKNATVKDVFEKALGDAHISYINRSGNYVSSINGLAEFDNGPNSGWMYMINGSHPSVGLKEYVLQGGEAILWHYTDDYTKEESSEKWGSKPNTTPSTSGGGGGGSGKADAQTDNKANEEAAPTSEATTNTQAASNTVQKSFTDVKADHWAKEAIETLASKGVIQGKSEIKFAPNEKVTRAEFITMLYRMSKEDAQNDNEVTFKDVKAEDWFAVAVNWGVKVEIIKGIDEENFGPQCLVTREQMAAMLARYIRYMKLELKAEENKEAFKDEDNISDYAKESVKTLQQYNIMKGKGKNSFVPKDQATRAEAAQILVIIFKQNEK